MGRVVNWELPIWGMTNRRIDELAKYLVE